jgi:DNA-binding transcriptional ArsR family regulator
MAPAAESQRNLNERRIPARAGQTVGAQLRMSPSSGASVDPYGDAEMRDKRQRRGFNPFSPSGRRVVLQLLIDPKPQGVRALARGTDLSPATTSRVLDALRAEGLVDDDNPLIPELFWELATHWKSPETVTVRDIIDQELNNLGYEWALDRLITQIEA